MTQSNEKPARAQSETTRFGNTVIIHDAVLLGHADDVPVASLFDKDYHTNNPTIQNANQAPLGATAGTGRAKVRYFSFQGLELVYKHYYRGGMIARVIKDHYLAGDPEATRAFCEYRLLKVMASIGLPVPVAVAARVRKMGFLPFCSCDLVTQQIPDVLTLADYLAAHSLPEEHWFSLGATIRRFHDQGVYHADLNARNVMLEMKQGQLTGKLYLIDFDKAAMRCTVSATRTGPAVGWQASNLTRLHRSLKKFRRKLAGFSFAANEWQALLNGYQDGK